MTTTIKKESCPRCGRIMNTRRGNYCAFCGYGDKEAETVKLYSFSGEV